MISFVLILLSVFALLMALVRFLNFYPKDVQYEPVISAVPAAKLIQPGQTLKILSWNVQYMAGKNYVFFYDLPGGDGPHERPKQQDLELTLQEVARVIRDENPDIVLLQEMEEGSRRSAYQDQWANLSRLLPSEYASYASAFYWKSKFVPHPRVMGSTGMKLVIFSKYAMREAVRYQLPLMPNDFLTRQFYLKRAVLAAEFPMENGQALHVMNVHTDSSAQGTDTMQKQIQKIKEIVDRYTSENKLWILGGDFNLLPSGAAYRRLSEKQKHWYREETELAPLMQLYSSIPSLSEADGPDYRKWLTHWSNDPEVTVPDRTVDYIFSHPKIAFENPYVRLHDTQKISDHFPVVTHIKLP